MEYLKFEQCFTHDKYLYDGVILFFDNMIRRNFINILEKLKDGKSGMICDTIGYNLPDDNDEKNMNYIEIWWICGLHDYSCNINFELFIESLELATKIWIKNNNINSHDDIAHKIESYIKIIKHRYT